MAGSTLIEGTAYEIKSGMTKIEGTDYSILSGKTLIDGTAYDIIFGIKLSINIDDGAGEYSYVTVNGVNYTSSTTLTVQASDIVSVYVSAQGWSNQNKCYIYHNGTKVLTGKGTYNIGDLGSSCSITISRYENEDGGGAWHTVSIRTN